eukprot:TRINITY_DN16468_c1_g1_i1.p1 TRINITY_DN16468_c1_g1~~TRINITY_DN16468_c1_g1_i1.p1  ORF type:complete len:168 (+),score=5.43 TRINITY_DN16468_c1_g1_i1:84-587(+)
MFVNYLPRELRMVAFVAQTIIEVVALIGGINVVLQGMIIGASLFSGRNRRIPLNQILLMQKPVHRDMFVAVVAIRGFFVPMVTYGLVLLLTKYGILPQDPVCTLFLLVQGVMPTAQNLVLLTQVQEKVQNLGPLVSQLIVLQYLCMFLTVTFWMVIFMVSVQLDFFF